MECSSRGSRAQQRLRAGSIDAAFLFDQQLSFNCEMQSQTSPSESGQDLTKLMKRLRNKSWAAGAKRSSLQVEKRAVSSFDQRRSSHGTRCNGYQFEPSHKVGHWDMKTNVPKRWLREYEKKQAELRKERKKKLQPLDRFRRAVRLIQTCNTAFRSIVHYAVEKGQHEQVTSDATLSLKTAAVQGTVENLMFDPEHYKCHHEFLMPRWAKEITSKEPKSRTQQEIHSIVQLMKQLKGFRRYSSKIQEALCRALKYDCFGRRRVVIRKGHVAQRFYFIFSGSVCVTADDDEHSAFAKPTENSVFNRGDYFGELAFIRGLKRSATVVCLERTELLSVEKEDFFSAKIDVCFNADMQRRVEFLKEHQVFTTWPEDVVTKVAEESRLQDYNSDEVIVRDSSKLHWVIFVTKGQCDVLRLLDLSNCKDYIEHAVKYRMDRIQDDTTATYSPNTDEISLSSIVLRGFPPRTNSPEVEPKASSGKTLATHGMPNPAAARVHTTEKSTRHDQTSAKGILHSEKPKGKSAKGRVSFRDDQKQDSTLKQEPRASDSTLKQEPRTSSEPLRAYNSIDGEVETEVDEGLIEERADGSVGVGVYMMVDRLRPGQCFGSWSLLEQEDKCLPLSQIARNTPDQTDRELNRRPKKKKKPRERQFTLVSGGCEVIKVAKEVFFKYSDDSTLEKLRKLTTTYPRDSILCQRYLRQSDWRTYREEIVDNVAVRHIARLETAKGSARSHTVRSSPVPSPLCSMKMWPPVTSKWEYFPETGWVSGQVAHPAIEAGTSRANSGANADCRTGTTSTTSSPSLRNTPPRPRGSSGAHRVSPGTHRGSSGRPRGSPGTRRGSSGTPRGSPIPLPMSASRSPEKLLPLVTNDLVLAQGSQRALVLTQGGGRCNDYQLQIERRVINKHYLKKNNAQIGKVT